MSAVDPSFTDWLACQQHRNDPIGDLARDVAIDTLWPVDQDNDLQAMIRRIDPSDFGEDGFNRKPAVRALIKARAEWKIRAHQMRPF